MFLPRRNARSRRLALEILEDRTLLSTVGVDATANVHAISPLVYGTAFASTAQLADLHIPLNRNGGNASDTYSYPQDATNHGSDWYFESIASGSGNGQGIDSFINATHAGGAQPSITLNLFDWAAKLGANQSILGSFSVPKYGPQQATDPYNPTLWGNGVHTNGTNITGNDPNDAYLANSPAVEQAWIQHLISTFGNSQSGGVQYYNLGNEPGLWNSTHRDIHPAGDTLPELRDRIINYASMVKSLDPNAKILGPEEWGWTNYFISGADAAASNWGATYNGLNAEAWLLDQLRQHDAATGQRLLDYFTLHFYPQGGQFSNDVSTNMELLRNRSTRSLWDPNYVDESWIANTGINGGKVNLINLMKNWVNTYYPGTKIGVTEYNWGAEGNMNGATTQADIWGIFGREGLDLADRWTTPATGSPTYLAMKMFRNYDGNGSAFGDTSVSASVGNPDQVDAFASTRSSDGALTVMVINKNLYDSTNPSATTSITVNLSNFAAGGTAQEWQLAAVNPSDQTNAAISHLSDIVISGNSFTLNVPMESVSLFVIKPASSAPAAPTGVAAVAGNAQVKLTWTASTGATSYNVYRSTSAGGEGTTPFVTGVTATTYTNGGLTNGITYFYKVTAVNASGESPQSGEVSATPQTAPAAPTSLNAAASNAQVTLTWTASTGATSYNLYRATTAGGEGTTPLVTGLTGTTFTNTGLSNGTTYFYKVTAVNGAGESPPSGEVSATPQVAPPAAPTSLRAAAGNAQITLTWTASPGATSYDVYRATTAGGEGPPALVTGLTATTFTESGLINGATYFYKVTAVNAGGQSGTSNEASATPQVPPPPAPTNLTATAGNAQVSLTWTASTGATSYNVYRSTSAGGEGTTPFLTGLTATSFTDTGLTNGTTYFYKVTAVNAGGQSGTSNEASATPTAPVTFTGAHVNFTGNASQTPAGYVSDTGLAFGPRGNGLSYGWNIDNSVNAFDRDSPLSPDELHDSFVAMQKPSDPNASWQIGVPNGTYTVHVAAGDPSAINSTYKINVNGILAVNGTPTSAHHWVEGTVTVTVTNGLLVVSNAAHSKNNKIDFIDIAPATRSAQGAAVPTGKFAAGFGFRMTDPQSVLALSLRGATGDATLTFDPSANAVGLSAGGSGPVRAKGKGLNLADGDAFAVALHYRGAKLRVQLTDTATGQTFRHAFRVKLPRVVGPSALAEFSGAADVLGWWIQAF
jgi:fibronectin type 3 domain-containing protein